MNSFLRRKQAQIIVALVMAITLLATVVGLGLSTEIAKAASPLKPGYSITIRNVSLNANTTINVNVDYKCPAGTSISINITVVQKKLKASLASPFAFTCNGQQENFGVGGQPPSGFTRGKAKATAQLVDAAGTVVAKTTRTVTIA